MIKYLKYYTGRSTGGRDEGYPVPCVRVYETIEELAKDHGTTEDERYEVLEASPAPPDFEEQIQAACLRNEAEAEEKRQERIRAKIAELQRQLND